MKRVKKPDARPSPFTLRERYDWDSYAWVKDPKAPVYPSQSKSINHAAFKKTVEAPSLVQVMNKLRAIEALAYRQQMPKMSPVTPARRPWWSRLSRTLFMPWASE